MRRIALFSLIFLFMPLFRLHAEGEIDLLWQGETYTPPFYQGRALWGVQTRVTVSVIPHIPNASSLYYRWTKDGTVLGSLSGINKRSLTFVDSVLSTPMDVKVDLRDGEDGPIMGSSTITLNPTPERVLVLEDNPLYGLMLHKAVGSLYALEGSEVSFSAVPLFAPVLYRAAPAFDYTWTTNTGDSRKGNRVTYRAPENSSGSSSVRLRMEDSNVIALPPTKEFLVQFGNQNGF